MDTRPPGPILVLTYKNHALDEFLENCIPRVSLSKIARGVGSRSKSEKLIERNVKRLLNTDLGKTVESETRQAIYDLRDQLLLQYEPVAADADVAAA